MSFRSAMARAGVPAAALGLALAAPAAASADVTGHNRDHDGDGLRATVTTANINELNDTDAEGRAVLTLEGNTANVAFYVRGVLENAPHAQHFHIMGKGVCPTDEADTNGDNIVSTPEGQPAYGKIGTSLTEDGDTSPKSALAVERFPNAENGVIKYQRSIDVSDATAKSIRKGNAVLVVHGIDANDSGKYDGEAKSPLNPALPLEATAPAACGEFNTNANLDLGDDLGLGLGLDLDSLLGLDELGENGNRDDHDNGDHNGDDENSDLLGGLFGGFRG